MGHRGNYRSAAFLHLLLGRSLASDGIRSFLTAPPYIMASASGGSGGLGVGLVDYDSSGDERPDAAAAESASAAPLRHIAPAGSGADAVDVAIEAASTSEEDDSSSDEDDSSGSSDDDDSEDDDDTDEEAVAPPPSRPTVAAAGATSDVEAEDSSCSVCGVPNAKYKCPGCLARTCCVSCVTAHKATTHCSGRRNAVAHVDVAALPPAELQRVLVSDFRFLEDVARSADAARRVASDLGSMQSFVRPSFVRGGGRGGGRGGRGGGATRPGADPVLGMARLPPHLHLLLKHAKARGVNLRLMPRGMQRHEANTSVWKPANKKRKRRPAGSAVAKGAAAVTAAGAGIAASEPPSTCDNAHPDPSPAAAASTSTTAAATFTAAAAASNDEAADEDEQPEELPSGELHAVDDFSSALAEDAAEVCPPNSAAAAAASLPAPSMVTAELVAIDNDLLEEGKDGADVSVYGATVTLTSDPTVRPSADGEEVYFCPTSPPPSPRGATAVAVAAPTTAATIGLPSGGAASAGRGPLRVNGVYTQMLPPPLIEGHLSWRVELRFPQAEGGGGEVCIDTVEDTVCLADLVRPFVSGGGGGARAYPSLHRYVEAYKAGTVGAAASTGASESVVGRAKAVDEMLLDGVAVGQAAGDV